MSSKCKISVSEGRRDELAAEPAGTLLPIRMFLCIAVTEQTSIRVRAMPFSSMLGLRTRIRLESLCEGGSLVLPLTIPAGMGGMGANLGKGVVAKITGEANGFSARIASGVTAKPANGGHFKTGQRKVAWD